MEWIEILGLPGAGKTSLLKNLKSTSVSNGIKQTWYDEQTVKFGIIKNLKRGNFELSNKLLRAKIISNQKLKNKERWKELIKIHKEGLKALELPVKSKYKLISFYSNLISRVSKYSDLNLSKPIFLDEGLIHNNFAKNDHLQNLLLRNCFIPKLVLYLEADILEVTNEIKNFNSFESRGMEELKSLSKEEIKKIILKKDTHTQEKINFLQNMSVPIIKLKREDCQNITDLISLNKAINKLF